MRFLTADQKQQCVSVYEELHKITSDDATFLSRLRESWIYGCDSETKQHISHWKMRSEVKSMLIIFFNIKGIVLNEFVQAC
jgi:hypothetical protein